MNCRDAEIRITDLVDGNADAELSEHLATCEACLAVEEKQRAAVAFMSTLGPVDPPADLRRRVLRSSPARARAGMARWAWGVPVAAAAVLAVVVYWPDPPSKPPPKGNAELSQVSDAEKAYVDAIAQLEARVNEQRGQWPSDLGQTFEANLAIIDKAIVDTRKLATKHADHPDAHRYVLAAYEEKVDLLTEASEWDF